MKYLLLLTIGLFFSNMTAYAGSIYKCTHDNGKITFTDKPCDDMKMEIIHQETEEEAEAKALERKRNKINRLIRAGKDLEARNYAAKHQLEDIYQEEVKAYNLHLEQQLKQEELASKKQEQDIKEQQLLMQRQSLLLQEKELAQQNQQLKTQQQKTNYGYYPYAYPYTWPSAVSNCKQYGSVRKCNQPSYRMETQSTPEWQKKTIPEWQRQQMLRNQNYNNGNNIKGNVSIQLKNKNNKSGIRVHGKF